MTTRSTRSNSEAPHFSQMHRRSRGASIGSSPGTPKTSVLEVLKAFDGALDGIIAGASRNQHVSRYLRYEDVQEIMHKSLTPEEAASAGGHPYLRQIAEILAASSPRPRRRQDFSAFTLDPDVIAFNEEMRKNPLQPKAN